MESYFLLVAMVSNVFLCYLHVKQKLSQMILGLSLSFVALSRKETVAVAANTLRIIGQGLIFQLERTHSCTPGPEEQTPLTLYF
jgi:hypothetical protein